MPSLTNIMQWLESNNNVAYSLIRIFLGVALFVRGVIMISDPMLITNLTGANQYYWWYSYVMIAHIAGGLFMALGIFARLGAFVQIPILTGAVLLVHFKEGLLSVGQSLELSVLVLVLLVIYFVFGPGPLSVDNVIARKKSIGKEVQNNF